MTQVFQEIQAIVVELLGVDASKVTEAAHFENDLGADSLDRLEMVMEAEQRFATEITDDEAEDIETVGDAVKMIEAKLQGA